MRNLKTDLLMHLDAAYNLARWLTRNDKDAKDVVQDAFLRALKYSHTQHGNELRAWFLKIVRNTGYTWLKNQRAQHISFEEENHGAIESDTPEDILLRGENIEEVRKALESLPVEFREALVLRELEELPYQEISDIVGVPLGTIMSRLSRGRAQLAQILKIKIKAGDSR